MSDPLVSPSFDELNQHIAWLSQVRGAPRASLRTELAQVLWAYRRETRKFSVLLQSLPCDMAPGELQSYINRELQPCARQCSVLVERRAWLYFLLGRPRPPQWGVAREHSTVPTSAEGTDHEKC